MHSFKQFIVESSDPNYGLGNAEKARLHEILVGHFLMHPPEHSHPDHWTSDISKFGKFPTRPIQNKDIETPDATHDRLRTVANQAHPENYDHHVRIAKFAAENIRSNLIDHGYINSKSNHRSVKVHWTSNPTDIEALVGAKDIGNKSDVTLKYATKKKPGLFVETEHPTQKLVGVSLKMQSKSRRVTHHNSGHEQLDAAHGVDTKPIVNSINKKLARHIKSTTGFSLDQLKKRYGKAGEVEKVITQHPDLASRISKYNTQARVKITQAYSQQTPNMSKDRVRNAFASMTGMHQSNMPVFTSLTTGTSKLKHKFYSSNDEINNLYNQHGDHLAMHHKAGGNIIFTGKENKPLARINLRTKGRTTLQGMRGDVTLYKQ